MTILTPPHLTQVCGISTSYGQRITLENSGGIYMVNPPPEVLLDYISIVPEPSSFELLVFAGFLLIGMRSAAMHQACGASSRLRMAILR